MDTTNIFDNIDDNTKSDMILRLLDTDEAFKLKMSLLKNELLSNFKGYIKSIPSKFNEKLLDVGVQSVEPPSPEKEPKNQLVPRSKITTSHNDEDFFGKFKDILSVVEDNKGINHGKSNDADFFGSSANKEQGLIDKTLSPIITKFLSISSPALSNQSKSEYPATYRVGFKELYHERKLLYYKTEETKKHPFHVVISSISNKTVEQLKKLNQKKEGIFADDYGYKDSPLGFYFTENMGNQLVEDLRESMGGGKGVIKSIIGSLIGSAVSGLLVKYGLSGVLKFAGKGGIVGMTIASVMLLAYRGIFGYFHSEEWGVSKAEGIMGTLLGGTGGGGFESMFKTATGDALIGATIGFVAGGPIGAIIGALIGAIFGGIMGWIGGEKISKWIHKQVEIISDTIFGGAEKKMNATMDELIDEAKIRYKDQHFEEIYKGIGGEFSKNSEEKSKKYNETFKIMRGIKQGEWTYEEFERNSDRYVDYDMSKSKSDYLRKHIGEYILEDLKGKRDSDLPVGVSTHTPPPQTPQNITVTAKVEQDTESIEKLTETMNVLTESIDRLNRPVDDWSGGNAPSLSYGGYSFRQPIPTRTK